jgi:hypothetical protein
MTNLLADPFFAVLALDSVLDDRVVRHPFIEASN